MCTLVVWPIKKYSYFSSNVAFLLYNNTNATFEWDMWVVLRLSSATSTKTFYKIRIPNDVAEATSSPLFTNNNDVDLTNLTKHTLKLFLSFLNYFIPYFIIEKKRDQIWNIKEYNEEP